MRAIPDPTGSFMIIQMLKSLHKGNLAADTRLPIDKNLLGKLIHATQFTTSSLYERSLFSAMFSLAYHAFLRVGEMTTRSAAAQNPHLLHLSNIHWGEGYITVTFLSYKHSQGTSFSLRIEQGPNNTECPLVIMKAFLQRRGPSQGPLFRHQSGQPILRQDFDRALKRALAFNKLDSQAFKGHSFRIGAATSAAAIGLPDSRIRQLGRWKSDAFKKYIRSSYNVSAL